MYNNVNNNQLSNSVFLCIRNTPYSKLNTGSFRRKLLSIVEEYLDFDLPEDIPYEVCIALLDRLNDCVIAAENYSVHFVSSPTLLEDPKLSSLYGFENFPGVFVLRNFLTEQQCLLLACETLRSYINPPSNSNLLANDPNITSPLWPSESFKSLRWSTIGHLYDWEKREYNGHSEFPDIIVRIVHEINRLLVNFYHPFTADSAIINFYSKSYFLRLHRDDAEETDDPVINISLGAPAIFCICKDDLSQFPLSCVVDSGSIVIMSKDSRRCLHGISKLLHYVKPDSNTDLSSERQFEGEKPFAKPFFIDQFPMCPDRVFDGFSTPLNQEQINNVKSYLTQSRMSISIRKAKIKQEVTPLWN